MKYKIDALRFWLKKSHKKEWASNSIGMIKTTYGAIRAYDSQSDKEAILFAPDGPNMIEHYQGLITDLEKYYRVIIFELPGFGFSYHFGNYDYSFGSTVKSMGNFRHW